MDNHQSKKFALCIDRGCGGSGAVRRMSIVGYGGGKFRDGMLLVEGGIVNLGESFSGRGCRIGSGGLIIGSEACCTPGLGLPGAAYQAEVTNSYHTNHI